MKRALLKISNDFLGEFLKGNLPEERQYRTDAPKDLRVVGVEHPPAGFGHIWFYAVLESESFMEVKPGEPLPELNCFTYWPR